MNPGLIRFVIFTVTEDLEIFNFLPVQAAK